jgi:Quercetinase C-terminal cupin domain
VIAANVLVFAAAGWTLLRAPRTMHLSRMRRFLRSPFEIAWRAARAARAGWRAATPFPLPSIGIRSTWASAAYGSSTKTGAYPARDSHFTVTATWGITHGEFNPSKSEPVHFLRIWIIPDQRDLPPSYEQKEFPIVERSGRLRLVAAADAFEGAVKLHQDARLFLAGLRPGEKVMHAVEPGRGISLQVARGILGLNGIEMREGDGAAVEAERSVEIEADTDGEVLLFDLG